MKEKRYTQTEWESATMQTDASGIKVNFTGIKGLAFLLGINSKEIRYFYDIETMSHVVQYLSP